MDSIKKYIAEFIGTGVLVVGGCGTAVAINAVTTNAGGHVPTAATIIAIALAFGLSIVAMAYSIGNVSGCHINPAVSLGVLITGGMSVKDFFGYVIAQCLGALAGAGGLWLVFGSNASLGANGYGDNSALHIGALGAGIVEVVLTFIFVLLILGVTSKAENSKIAGLVIGLTLVFVHLIGISFTGTSVNPARSFGPAILQGGIALRQLYVFIIAPLVGALVAGLVHKFLIAEKS
ncbi:MAG: aquaporin [Ruminococcus sp.]|jgi:aquaporin Z|nr:aquaporin [Ruminococcus sp.]